MREAELAVYYRVRRFLKSVDETRQVEASTFQAFQEAMGEADFLFPPELCEWLWIVESEASAWEDGHTRIERWLGEGGDKDDPWILQEKKHMDTSIDALQNASSELLERFKPHVRAP